MRTAILAMIVAAMCGAQTTVNGGRDYKGTLKSSGTASSVDFSWAGSTAPVKTGTAAARPTACTQGQIYFSTDATAGQNLSFCTATGTPGTWSAMTGGGGSSGAGVSYCAPAGGSGTTYACAPSPALTSYAAGVTVAFVPDVNGTGGATTLNVNGLGAKSVKQADGSSNPTSTDFAAGRVYLLSYDGTVFRIQRSVQTKAATSHQFLTGVNADGSLSAAQPSANDVTGLATSATTDTTSASNIATGTLADARLSSNVPLKNGSNGYTGYNDMSAGSWRPPETTVANMPTAAGVSGRVYLVTDASNAGSCSAGGGSTRTLCRSNGSNYECIGNCSSGGGGGSPGGANGQMQYNNSGSFAGQPFVLSGSVFQRGAECSSGTVSFSSLTANSATQEVTVVSAMPAKFRFLHMVVQETTQFAGSVSSLSVSAGRPGIDTDLIPALGLKSATAPQNFWFDRPATPVLGAGTFDVVLQFVGSSVLGNGSASNLTAGAVYWEVCGFAAP